MSPAFVSHNCSGGASTPLMTHTQSILSPVSDSFMTYALPVGIAGALGFFLPAAATGAAAGSAATSSAVCPASAARLAKLGPQRPAISTRPSGPITPVEMPPTPQPKRATLWTERSPGSKTAMKPARSGLCSSSVSPRRSFLIAGAPECLPAPRTRGAGELANCGPQELPRATMRSSARPWPATNSSAPSPPKYVAATTTIFGPCAAFWVNASYRPAQAAAASANTGSAISVCRIADSLLPAGSIGSAGPGIAGG